ncbi:hypothetical protein [Kocuria sp. CH-021]|uniref:hypothetical protein n=1 Tax=Kocuria sp. CH-021 TaxID=3406735 RepID=UPI003C72F212
MRHTAGCPWRTSGLAFLIFVAVVECGATRSADDVARQLARSSSEVEEVSQAITRANGGSARLERKTAEQLASGTGVLSRLMDSDDVSAVNACFVYQATGAFIDDGPEVQELLSQMEQDLLLGKATNQSINLACDLRGALDGI